MPAAASRGTGGWEKLRTPAAPARPRPHPVSADDVHLLLQDVGPHSHGLQLQSGLPLAAASATPWRGVLPTRQQPEPHRGYQRERCQGVHADPRTASSADRAHPSVDTGEEVNRQICGEMACSRKQPAAVLMWGREGLGDMGKPLAVIKPSLVAIFRTVQPLVLLSRRAPPGAWQVGAAAATLHATPRPREKGAEPLTAFTTSFPGLLSGRSAGRTRARGHEPRALQKPDHHPVSRLKLKKRTCRADSCLSTAAREGEGRTWMALIDRK
jgi:hypothetical protein